MGAKIIFESPDGLGEVGYIYNVSSQTIAVEADIVFDTNGFLTSGITHTTGTSHITFSTSGKYLIIFNVSSILANQFAIFKNNSLVTGTVYGTGVANVQNTGLAIVTISAGDFITIRNHTSTLPIVLGTLIGGTQTSVNASVGLLRVQ
jgi:hypothetical protein